MSVLTKQAGAILLNNRPAVANWRVANAAALSALVPESTDLDKLAHQLDTDEVHLLTDDSPLTFINLRDATKLGGVAASLYATKSYADSLVTGLLDDRGNYDASGNAFPSTGGSGTAGAVLKGDLWVVSVAGTLGGIAVAAGDLVRALIDTPGQTASNWAVTESNFGYTPENPANKATSLATLNNVLYPTTQAVANYAQPLDATLTAVAALDATAGLLEQTALDTFTKRALGVAASTSIPTLGDADARFAALVHAHVVADVTGLQAALDLKAPLASPALTGVVTITSSNAAALAVGPTGATLPALQVDGSGAGAAGRFLSQSATQPALRIQAASGAAAGQGAFEVYNGSAANVLSLTAAGQFLAANGSAAAPTYSFANNPTMGMYRQGNFEIGFANGGSEVLRINSSNQLVIVSNSLTFTANLDTTLLRDAAGTLAQKNGNNDQLFRSYAANNGYWERGSISELITLSTGGATTDSTADLLPANSIIEAVTARITTTITTATDWALGDATIAARFAAANATLTAGTTAVGLQHVDQTGTSGPKQTAAAKLRVTATGTPGAGAIRVTVYFRRFVAPGS